jgi:salicylate hydroxylase
MSPKLIHATPQSPRWPPLARPPLACWNRGPVVLLGDSAHAMLPQHGEGANQLIEDAFVLAEELGRGSDDEVALQRYLSRRRAGTRKVQLMSWAALAALHRPDGASAQCRDAYLPGCRNAWRGSTVRTCCPRARNDLRSAQRPAMYSEGDLHGS